MIQREENRIQKQRHRSQTGEEKPEEPACKMQVREKKAECLTLCQAHSHHKPQTQLHPLVGG